MITLIPVVVVFQLSRADAGDIVVIAVIVSVVMANVVMAAMKVKNLLFALFICSLRNAFFINC